MQQSLQRRMDEPEDGIDRRGRLEVVSGEHFAAIAVTDKVCERINRAILLRK